jgi:hypothetical protein
MPTSHAHVRTDRAGRYLAQLCNHGSQLARIPVDRHRAHGDGGPPPAVQRADCSETDGLIDFGWGRCTLRATDDALILTAEADDMQKLHQIQDGVARRLERIGRRDRLTLSWRPRPEAGTGEQDGTQHGSAGR